MKVLPVKGEGLSLIGFRVSPIEDAAFDLIGAVKVQMPDEYKSALYNLADHLTFNREFGDFIKEKGISREMITHAILWCVGAVTVNARVMFRSN